MLKIMIADDEGIVIEALRFIIENNLEERCVIESAKSGRQVIELAERFRPDIAFMDIQMPGINGVKAMQEIRKTNKEMIFIVVTAYEKFDYAKDAIAIGVLDYLNKPIQKGEVLDVLNKAIDIVKTNKQKRADELEIQEKLETVLPVIETGLIYSILFQEDYAEDIENYAGLLGIEDKTGYMMVVRFGDDVNRGKLTNAIGTAVKTQQSYEKMRSIIKEYTGGIVGAMMGNNIIVFTPSAENTDDEYDARIAFIDKMRKMARVLRQEIEAEFRIGIGGIMPLVEMEKSYHQALQALRLSSSTVAHAKDMPIECKYEETYPVDIEKKLFQGVENGDTIQVTAAAKSFFVWMENQEQGLTENIRLKVLEFVLWAEKIAYETGTMTYKFDSRNSYLSEVMEAADFSALRDWFISKITQATEKIKIYKKESSVDVIDKAKEYIETNYKDVSLDVISRQLDISPYYFSKLFKEKTGVNFIDYVTDFKIAKAKEMLSKSDVSMKEICIDIGYATPNYFSYIFKKKVGVTPSEYREGLE